MTGVLHCRVVYASEIIVVSVFCQIQTVADHAVDGIIRISIKIEEPCVLIYAMADTICSKVVPINRVIMVVAQLYIPKTLVAITVLVKEVKITFNGVPLTLNKAGAIIVAFTVVSGQPCALHQFAVFKFIDYIGEEAAVFTIQPLESLGLKVVIAVVAICIREVPPTGSGDTVDGVVGGTVKLNKAGDFSLAGASRFVEAIEILVAFIVKTGNFVNAFQSIVFGEVIRNTVYGFPTGPRAIVKNEAVGEFLIRFTVEVAALGMNGVFRFLIGVNAVLLLERGLAGHVIERICAEINVIAHGTGVSNGQSLVCAPRCAVLNGELHAAENTNGVGRIRIDGLALLDEVTLDGKKIVFINFRRGKREVVVRHRKSVKIYINIRVKLEFYRYFGLAANALCQLEQQIPSCNAGNIATGNHFKQRFKLFGNFYRHHIQTEDIGDIHRQIGVNYMVTIRGIVAAGDIFRVGNCSCPRKGSAAACCIVEVENSLIFAVHCNFKRGTD